MGRSIRNAKLTLGLLAMSVGVETCIRESEETKFKLVCVGLGDKKHEAVLTRMGGGPTRAAATAVNAYVAPLRCPACDNGERATFLHGQEVDGNLVVLSAEDYAKLEASNEVKENIALTAHHTADLAETIMAGKVYWLKPRTTAEHKTYATLVALLKQKTDVTYVAEFAIKTVPALYALGTSQGALFIRELARPECIQPPPIVETTVSDKDLKMAAMLADASVEPFNVLDYHDKRAALAAELIAASAGQVPSEPSFASILLAPSGDLTSALELALKDVEARKIKTTARATKPKVDA